MDSQPLRKRVKTDFWDGSPSRRSISPPATRNRHMSKSPIETVCTSTQYSGPNNATRSGRYVPSPVQLNKITDLPASSNVDSVSLQDILGDPLISECWIFNYLFDVDFIMSQLDEDVQDTVQVNLVHGSWKREDSNRLRIEAAMQRYKNVHSTTAHMPEPYGTHHSKMIILFRHDDQAQINILTGNMVAGDWRMSQAVWRSPLLPLVAKTTTLQPPSLSSSGAPVTLGSGARFKSDLLAYLRGYNRLGNLVQKINLYDFKEVRGTLIASLPRKEPLARSEGGDPLWGLPGFARVLQSIPSNQSLTQAAKSTSRKSSIPSSALTTSSSASSSKPHIIIQISSVASIGEKWLREFFLPRIGAISSPAPSTQPPSPHVSMIFPTADEIRRSIDGYRPGGSIHMRTQSPAQRKQLDFIRPMLCHWAGDNRPPNPPPIREAGRRRAAPHTKTYVRFSDASLTRIDWAMMTSANLSTQAWGSTTKEGQVRVCSYEIGILVWPALWDDGETGTKAEMVPVFKTDMPDEEERDEEKRVIKVGWRMPYDLPLVPYEEGEMPWCASEPCAEPDWMGRSWPGFGAG